MAVAFDRKANPAMMPETTSQRLRVSSSHRPKESTDTVMKMVLSASWWITREMARQKGSRASKTAPKNAVSLPTNLRARK